KAIPAPRLPPSVDVALRKALAPLLKLAGPAAGALAARWPEIVGPKLAQLTEPVEVKAGRGGGTLIIRAPSAAAPMIQHAQGHILERVSLASGSKVKALKIVQTAYREAAKLKPLPRALSSEEKTKLTRSLAEVEEPAVRRALAGLGEAVMAWGGEN